MGKLGNVITKVIGKDLIKGDISYETSPVFEGFISKVTCGVLGELPGLEKYASKSWTGKVGPDELHAEHLAAEVAYEELSNDSELKEKMEKKGVPTQPNPNKIKKNAKGKGKGKGLG